VSQSQRVQELDCFQGLLGYLSDLLKLKAFVLILFDEVKQTFAEGLEDEAHIWDLVVLLRNDLFLVHKELFEIHDSPLTTALSS